MSDLKFALRQLFKNPGFSSVAVLMLALGIGANTAIFSVVNGVLLNPIPGTAAQGLVQIGERDPFRGQFGEKKSKPIFSGVSPPVLEAIFENQDCFSDLTWIDGAQLNRRTEEFTQIVFGARVPPNFFAFFRVSPLLGRTFSKDEALPLDQNELPAKNPVIVLSYAGWQELFGGDPNVVGRNLELSGCHFTVIGVMPRYFRFPYGGTQFWFPSERLRLAPGTMTGSNISLFARLKPEIPIQKAEAMLATIALRLTTVPRPETQSFLKEDWQRRTGGLALYVRPARYRFTDGRDDLQQTLYGLLGAIGFVLLIVCANVANLSLAKTEKRQQEFAIRAALGSGRARLVRLLLAESISLSCIGGLAGLGIALFGIKLLTSLVPEYMPRMREIELDGGALAFTFLLSLATGILFGITPAWHVSKSKIGDALKQGSFTTTRGTERKRFRGALVVIEIALTLVLLTGAGLMIQSVTRLLHVETGFDPENLLRVYIDLPSQKYDLADQARNARQLLYSELQERLAALPGVKAAGLGKHGAWPEKAKIEGRTETMEALLDGCGVEQSDLFRAMRIPLLAGRYFERRDVGDGIGTTIINETMARTFWPGEDALGKKFGASVWRGASKYEVVGVVRDVRDQRYNQPIRPTFYRPCHELSLTGHQPFFVMRTQMDPRALIKPILQALKAAEAEMTAPRIFVVRQALYDETQAQRTYMTYLVVFAILAVVLSALGIYGVLAYSVGRRTQEISIRLALGAERYQVLHMIMAEGVRLVAIGLAAGALATLWLTRLLQNQLFEVRPTDLPTFAAAVLVISAVTLLACFLPARRAMRINPMEALRYE